MSPDMTSLSRVLTSWLLVVLLVAMSAAEKLCTKAVPVQTQPAKKVQILRRIPATCSNWDKFWTWITRDDCGTKYRTDYVTMRPRGSTQYRLEYVCCADDLECKEAERLEQGGIEVADEKLLAIVLGSAAAFVVVVIVIIAIAIYTNKTRCTQGPHAYSNTACDGSGALTAAKPDGGGDERKGMESEYAEIGDPHPPRYTDIFTEDQPADAPGGGDPFTHASAPPLYSEVRPRLYANADRVTNCTAANEQPSAQHGDGDIIQDRGNANVDGSEPIYAEPRRKGVEKTYCNVRDKKSRKKKNRRVSKTKCDSPDGSNTSGTTDVELVVRSSSASDALTRNSGETSSSKQGQDSTWIDSITSLLPVPLKSDSSPSLIGHTSLMNSTINSTSSCSIEDPPPIPPRCPSTSQSPPKVPSSRPPKSKSRILDLSCDTEPLHNNGELQSDSLNTSNNVCDDDSNGCLSSDEQKRLEESLLHSDIVRSEFNEVEYSNGDVPLDLYTAANSHDLIDPNDDPIDPVDRGQSASPCEEDALLTSRCGCGTEHCWDDCSQCAYYNHLKCPSGSEGDLASLNSFPGNKGDDRNNIRSSHDNQERGLGSSVFSTFPSKSKTEPFVKRSTRLKEKK